jgi:hypothetical protein
MTFNSFVPSQASNDTVNIALPMIVIDGLIYEANLRKSKKTKLLYVSKI